MTSAPEQTERNEDDIVRIDKERLRTIVEASRTLIAVSRYCMGLVVSDDEMFQMRIQDARDRIDEIRDAIHEGTPWPHESEIRTALEFYARPEHWTEVAEGAVARTLFVAARGDSMDGFSVAQRALTPTP